MDQETYDRLYNRATASNGLQPFKDFLRDFLLSTLQAFDPSARIIWQESGPEPKNQELAVRVNADPNGCLIGEISSERELDAMGCLITPLFRNKSRYEPHGFCLRLCGDKKSTSSSMISSRLRLLRLAYHRQLPRPVYYPMVCLEAAHIRVIHRTVRVSIGKTGD